MQQRLGLVTLVVRDYDEALAFFVGKLGFTLVEDTEVPEQSKRWMVVSPPGAIESKLLLARATTTEQSLRIGAQTGGRVSFFLYTDDFRRDYERFKANGVEFVRPPKREPCAKMTPEQSGAVISTSATILYERPRTFTATPSGTGEVPG